jgi:hypothetical protein
MPGTLSVKKAGAYEPAATAGAKIKVAGAYVDATNLKMKAGGVYQGGVSPGVRPVNTVPPSIAGTLATGSTLTVTQGTWTGTPTPVLLHRWEADGIPIPGGRGLTLTLTVNEAGKQIVCVEIGANSTGTASVNSNALTVPVVLGPEKLLDPSFDAGAGEWDTNAWTFPAGATQLQSVGISNALVESIANAVTAGKRYQFSMVISAIAGAQLRFNHGDGTVFTTTGTKTQLVDVATTGRAGIICNNVFVTATVTSMSVKEVL